MTTNHPVILPNQRHPSVQYSVVESSFFGSTEWHLWQIEPFVWLQWQILECPRQLSTDETDQWKYLQWYHWFHGSRILILATIACARLVGGG